VLQCAGNGRALYKPAVPGVQWKYGAVGNALWTGARVRDVLEKAGLKGSARHLHTFGSDDPPGKVPPFHRSVEIEKVLQDGILAYEMNGEPLPPLHGAPLRLIVPGWAGDHWMKWLVRLSAEPQPQTGFYMDVAYRYPKKPGAPGVTFKPDEMEPVTELAVKSNFVDPPRRARTGRSSTLRGFAFSGAPDVSRVELSDDEGKTWAAAELSPEHDPFAWRLWSYRWTPRARGKATVWVRATDSRGSVQPREAVWNQSGYLYNGWHSAEIEVTP
jgi:DMSO/TMAO reductase YedYZ molybdopterin-dependent catalytic subunit